MDEDIELSNEDADERTPSQEEDEDESCPLTKEIIQGGLSLLCRTGTRLGHAYIRLDLKDKQLVDIQAITAYPHVRLLYLSNNRLTDLSPLAALKLLLWLKVDNNAVATFQGQPFSELKYLQRLYMSWNHLTDVEGIDGPALESLTLTGNKIQSLMGFQTGCLENLVTLELRGNQIESLEGLNLPNLQRLYLAQNSIASLEGMDKLQSLTTLHLRDNRIETLDGLSPNLKCLEYINLRNNLLKDEPSLLGLKVLSGSLKAAVLTDNPLVVAEYRVSVLMVMPQLDRLDKEPVIPEERKEIYRRIKEMEEQEPTEQEESG